MSADHIVLSVPSRAEYARTVRMTAAALVSRLDMSYEDVDDVRIAAEEAFVYAVDHAPDDAVISIEFAVADDSIEVRVALCEEVRVTDEEAERRAAYATFILQSVCDHYELSSDDQGPYLRVVKRISAELPDAKG